MSFHNDGQIAGTPVAMQVFLDAYDITPLDYSVAESGIENTTFIVTTEQAIYALRVYRAGKKQPVVLQELRFMDMLRAVGLPIPHVHPTNAGDLVCQVTVDGQQWCAILQSHVSGTHPKTYSGHLLEQMAAFQAHMHTMGAEFAKTQTHHRTLTRLTETHFIKHIAIDELHSSELREFLERAKAYSISIDPELMFGYSHFDFDAGNLLVDDHDTITGILDFDDIAYGPFVVCLGYTLYDILEVTDDEQVLRDYVTRYNQGRQLTPNELSWLPIALLFRHYVLSVLSVLNGHTEPSEVQRYLALEKQLMKLDF